MKARSVLPESDLRGPSVSKAKDSQIVPVKRPIAFFIPGLEGGGAQRVFVTLVNTLVTMTDHPIHLVTSRDGGAFAGQVDERVVRVVLGPKHVSRSIFRLAGYIRRERPVAMISTLDYCNVIFLISARIARVPLRKVIRDATVVLDQPVSILGRVRRILMRRLMRVAYRYADDLIIITEDVADSLIANGIGDVEKMRRIPNPVSVGQDSMRANALYENSLNGKPFILGVGRLCHVKGFDTLIRAFAQLHRADIDLVLLGGGPLQAQLESLAESLGVRQRVVFVGFVENPSCFFERASLFVLSSRREGFSNVLVEALACGIPIVSTDCPGSPKEVLQAGRLGRLLSGRDPADWAEAIRMELESPTATPQERAARAQEFAPDRVAPRYLRVMLGLADTAASRLYAPTAAPLAKGTFWGRIRRPY